MSRQRRPEADAATLALSGWRYRALVGSALLAMAAYLFCALWSGWEAVFAAARKVGLAGVGLALALSLVNYLLRFLRWQGYLAALGHVVPWRSSLRVYLAGFALTATPGKAGEALRGVLLKRWNVSWTDSFAAFLSERLSDLLAVILLALAGLALYPSARWPVAVGALAMLAVFIVIFTPGFLEGAKRRVRGRGRLSRGLRYFLRILRQTRCCHSLRLFVAAIALGLVAWFAEAFAFYLVVGWMGLEISLLWAVFIYAISMLAGALSFMPGGLGSAEAVMGGLLMLSGMSGAEAVAATALTRLATLWFAAAIGIWQQAAEMRKIRPRNTQHST
jgi:uncharacterized protein (TIRG00374 family)